MLHAKTAVADGLWARVGSTNLNVQSWMGNWELDVAVEDAGFGACMEAMYEADLANATEVLLVRGPVGTAERRTTGGENADVTDAARRPRRRRRGGGSTSRAAAGAFRFGNTMGAALTATRHLGATEAWMLAVGGLLLLSLGGLAVWQPAVVAYPVAAVAVWLGLSLAGAAWRARRPR
jgi:cardiolipin synthase